MGKCYAPDYFYSKYCVKVFTDLNFFHKALFHIFTLSQRFIIRLAKNLLLLCRLIPLLTHENLQ